MRDDQVVCKITNRAKLVNCGSRPHQRLPPPPFRLDAKGQGAVVSSSVRSFSNKKNRVPRKR